MLGSSSVEVLVQFHCLRSCWYMQLPAGQPAGALGEGGPSVDALCTCSTTTHLVVVLLLKQQQACMWRVLQPCAWLVLTAKVLHYGSAKDACMHAFE